MSSETDNCPEEPKEAFYKKALQGVYGEMAQLYVSARLHPTRNPSEESYLRGVLFALDKIMRKCFLATDEDFAELVRQGESLAYPEIYGKGDADSE